MAKRKTVIQQPAPRDHESVRAIILANMQAERGTYEGLTTPEIAAYNRRLMFGDATAETWDDAAWSAIVD